MSDDTAGELGDAVIMSFVEVCLFLKNHLRENDWKWTHTVVHHPRLSRDAESLDNG